MRVDFLAQVISHNLLNPLRMRICFTFTIFFLNSTFSHSFILLSAAIVNKVHRKCVVDAHAFYDET